ncbi:MAG: DUF6580 family putative transport protein [Prosthecobacter sp.]|nr:DUF6580 family putative transport protein [Prosthecobacter sp.]
MNSESRRSLPLLWVSLLLVVLALILRWFKLESPGMTLLPNFGPWMALAFTGTLVFPRTLPWWVWPVSLAAVDFAAQGMGMWSLADGRWEVFLSYGCYGLAAWVASRWRGRVNAVQTLLGVAGCSVVFYVVSNSLCWWVKPYYAKDLSGWVQALIAGTPGFPPSWMFFRNSLVSDLGFSIMLLLAFNAEARVRSTLPIPWVRQPGRVAA